MSSQRLRRITSVISSDMRILLHQYLSTRDHMAIDHHDTRFVLAAMSGIIAPRLIARISRTGSRVAPSTIDSSTSTSLIADTRQSSLQP